jgi:hypothetical protein
MKLTRKQCEEFFENPANFCEPMKRESHVIQVGQTFAEERTLNGGIFEDETVFEEKLMAMFVWTPRYRTVSDERISEERFT